MVKRIIFKTLLLALVSIALTCNVCAQQKTEKMPPVKVHFNSQDSTAYGSCGSDNFVIRKNDEYKGKNEVDVAHRRAWKLIVNRVEYYYNTYRDAVEGLKDMLQYNYKKN